MDKKTTYDNLRSEIIFLIQRRDTYQLAAYTMVTTLWTLAFSQGISWLAMIPPVVLIPLARKICDCGYAMESLSAYMYVCLETREVWDWEYMHYQMYEYKKNKNPHAKHKPLKNISRYMFSLLSVISCLIFWLITGRQDEFPALYISAIAAVIQLVSVIWVTRILAKNADAIKYKCGLIEDWEAVADKVKNSTVNNSENQAK